MAFIFYSNNFLFLMQIICGNIIERIPPLKVTTLLNCFIYYK